MILNVDTPRWAKPLLQPSRYKSAKGGRGSGKSHFFAENLIADLAPDPHKKAVCIREIQKSLKYSAKSLVEDKIQSLGVSHLFEVTQTEIRHRHGTGVIIFQGMQDHTAESIKSLEGFDIAWVEEAQSLSKRSLRLLRPTIRSDKSEIWFSWNPDQPHDAVAQFLDSKQGPPDNAICVHINYDQNRLISETLLGEMRSDRERMPPEDFAHIWLGEYNTKSDAIIFSRHYRIDEFQPSPFWDGPYYGLDFGFASDPTAAVKAWTYRNTLYVEYEAGRTKLELDDTAAYLTEAIPDIASHAIRADNARPEAISYLKRHGLPSIKPADKGKNSVEEGIALLKSFDTIMIHSRCTGLLQEMRLYSYQTNRAGDILPKPVDAHNHYIDALRYAIEPLRPSQSSYSNWAEMPEPGESSIWQ